MAIKIIPDIKNGMHTRTTYDASTDKIKLIPKTIANSHPGSSSWTYSGKPWVIDGDTATMDNTDSGNYFLTFTKDLNQTTATPVTFRLKAKGYGITSEYFGNFGMQVIPTYTDGGLGDTSIPHTPEVYTSFGSGTWSDTQFSVTCVPTQPIQYIYVYIFARNAIGKLTVWDLEVFPQTGTKSTYGIWTSNPLDLYAVKNEKISYQPGESHTGISMSKFGFFYGDLANVDGLSSIIHGKQEVIKFDYIVTKKPSELTSGESQVLDYAYVNGVKLFGYTHIGSTVDIAGLTEAEVKIHIDNIASKNWYGVFFDMAGNDYGVTRTRFNTLTDYAHSKNLKVMANAWRPEDVLLVNTGVESKLGTDDWVLLESFYARSDDTYVGASGTTLKEAITNYVYWKSIAKNKGVKVASLAYRFSANIDNYTKAVLNRNNSYILSIMCGLDAWSFSNTEYNESVKPNINIGNSLAGSLTSISPTRWEINTDRATLWFEATGGLRTTGAYSTIGALDAEGSIISANKFADNIVDTKWETSSDKLNWVEWQEVNKPSRYVRTSVMLQP